MAFIAEPIDRYLQSLKYYIFIIAIFISVPSWAQETEYTATGEYQGKNIYVQNPLSPDKVNFCTSSVYLNEKLIITSPKTSAYEINLSHLDRGGAVFIKIVHKQGCKPKIINPQVIRGKNKFQFLNVSADAISVYWTTVGEQHNGKFYLEHYLYRKWMKEAEVAGKGSFESNQYSLKPDLHTGDNKYRIIYEQPDGKVFFSRVFEYFNDAEPVSFFPTKVVDKITLSKSTNYSVVDSYGNKVAVGKGKEITLNNLKAGLYFLYIDNREEKFVKK